MLSLGTIPGYHPVIMACNVVIAAEGSEGDNRPALAVARKLVERGYSVRAGTSQDYVRLWSSLGVPTLPMGPSSREFFLAHSRSLYGRSVAMLRLQLRLFSSYVDRQFEVLAPLVRDADVVLASGFVFAAATLAERYDKPIRHLVHAPVFIPSADIPPPGVPSMRLPPAANHVLWLGLGAVLNAIALPVLNERRRKLGLPELRTLKAYWEEPLVFAMDEELAPATRGMRALGIRRTAFPHLADDTPVPAAVERFLANGSRPVFIGFGSLLQHSEDATIGILREAFRRAGCRAIIYRPRVTPLPRDDGNQEVLDVGPLPHEKIFPRVALVVHHGGTGTVHTAAAAGVPQLAIPHFLDQYYYADRICQLGLGPKGIRWRALTARSLSRSIVEALGNDSYRNRAAALGETLRRRDGASEVAAMLAELSERSAGARRHYPRRSPSFR